MLNVGNLIFCMALHKKLFTAFIAGLSLGFCPATYAEGSSQSIGERLSAAFGNSLLFNDIAFEFVDKSDASFSCKWWVMKASQQHAADIQQINSTEKNALPYVVAARQDYMVKSIFPSLNEACSR